MPGTASICSSSRARHSARRAFRQNVYAAATGLAFASGTVAPKSPFWLLYFVLLGEVFFCFPPRLAAALSVASYMTLGIKFALNGVPAPRLIEIMGSMLFGYLFVGTTVLLAIEQRRAREEAERLLRELEHAHQQLLVYAVEVETLSVARERQRLAQDIHDSVAHVLTGLLMQLMAVRKVLQTDTASAAARLVIIEQAVRHGLNEVRRAVRALRPEHLEGVGGIEAMRRLCVQFGERTGIRVHLTTDPELALGPIHEVLF